MTGARLPHGYTNQSWVQNELVVKQYDGVDGLERLHTEVTTLTRVGGTVPVPRVVEVDQARAQASFTFMEGQHGQDLIDRGGAIHVLGAAGRTLRQLQTRLPGLVHGDYGPQNLLLDPKSWDIVAVLDWEFAHEGEAMEDLAWAEWIVRMHHPGAVQHLPALFEGYGERPAWSERHLAMQERCAALRGICLRRNDSAGAEMWRLRVERTRDWGE
jgi:Ser/Thr protein kinase RdoA (MazF antagonist)